MQDVKYNIVKQVVTDEDFPTKAVDKTCRKIIRTTVEIIPPDFTEEEAAIVECIKWRSKGHNDCVYNLIKTQVS